MTPTRGAISSLLALCLLIGASARIEAAPAEEPNLTFTARVEPAEVLPGGSGVVVIDVKVLAHVHVYAGKSFKVTPVAAKGVTYDAPTFSPPKSWKDPSDKEAEAIDVWFDKIEIKLPFKLAADALPPVKVGAEVKWSACNDDQCFPPEKTKEPVLAEVRPPAGWKPPEANPAAGTAPTMAPDLPADPKESPGGNVPPAPKSPEPAARVVKIDVENDAAVVTVRVSASEVRVLFEPRKEFHLYAPGYESPESEIRVAGKPSTGVTWKPAVWPTSSEDHVVTSPYEVVLGFEAKSLSTAPASLDLRWQGCNEANCKTPQEHTIAFDETKAWEVVPAAPAPAAPTTTASAVPEHGLLFPEVGDARTKSQIDIWWESLGLWILGPIFLTGILLSFTPCVLPIIPITVSIIGGGKADLPKSRLTLLLSFYVLGLSLAFGSMGLVSALTGGAISAAFQSPVALWVIAGVFVVLSMGMFGIIELQPPEWMSRLQGGAKGGNVIGAFLFGAMAALIASPCTGPVIAGMIVFTAQSGNSLLGFAMFVTLGLGMGAVFFAAGSLNLVMRPGPWMVWVRHGFGILLTGAAFYYLASSGKLLPPALFYAGFGLAIFVAVLVVRHLVKGQGRAIVDAAREAAIVAVWLVVATGAVAWMTREPTSEATKGKELSWVNVTNRAALVAEVQKARGEGKAVVIDVWAEWCAYCKAYDRVILGSSTLFDAFSKLHRIRLDLSEPVPGEAGIREGLGIPPGQPRMVFIDAHGNIQRGLDVDDWLHGEATSGLEKRVKALSDVK